MVGDHNYSSLAIDDPRTVKGDSAFQHLAANTDRKTRQCKQTLDEHLIGVATFTARFARYLPTIATRMPTIEKHRALEKNTNIARFNWQNRAFQIAKSIQKNSQEHGFFGINMASTGCGKTIANARIMYGLADPKVGARFTIALGLRVLTLQTGKSFREDLHFSDEQLAILVGGTANTKLFEYQQQEKANLSYAEYENLSFQNTLGSESSEQLIEEILDSNIDYQDYNELNIDTILQDTTARNLLLSPVVSCTIDHIIQASECKRGGKFIAPMLRLLSSDLILDEPDDFDQSDLPALARLVYLAGVLGSRVLLSSATLPPDLMIGLYKAYLAGRKIFNHSQNKTTPNVVCAWFDEQDKASTSIACTDVDNFQQAHEQFILKRQQFLAAQEVRRKAEILPLDILYHHEKKEQFYTDLATSILSGALQLHHHHSQADPKTQKNISVGLVRIANIQQLCSIALQFFTQCTIPDDVHIHLACYHSKQLLILRNQLENKLDRILKRNMAQPEGIFKHIEIQQALEKSKAKQHIFIVLATPVAEVGRDHDYDWAIVEPSSMRSIIQLAGRVWRHRPEKHAKQSNILIMQYNIRYLRHQKTLKNTLESNQSIFIRPGFETDKFKPFSYDLCKLIPNTQLQHINANARIYKDKNIEDDCDKTALPSLSSLEHHVMADLMNSNKINVVNAYWHEASDANRTNTHLQQLTPFRDNNQNMQQDWIFVPNPENKLSVDAYIAKDIYDQSLKEAKPQNQCFAALSFDFKHLQVTPWLVTSLDKALVDIQQYEPEQHINAIAVRYATVSLDQMDERNSRGWFFSEYLGFLRQ